MPTQLDQFDTTRRKANFAISIASALIACVVIIGTLLRLRMEGFQMVFPLMWTGSALSIAPLILINKISYQAKSFSLWLSWTFMAFGAFLMFGIGSAGMIFFLVATTFAALNFKFSQVLALIAVKGSILLAATFFFSQTTGLPIPPQGIIFFQQPHIWIVHTFIVAIAAVAIVYVTTVWNQLNQQLLEDTELSFYNGIGLLSLAHDTETGEHLARVTAYTRLLAEEYSKRHPDKSSNLNVQDLSLAAQLHDVGKITIPATVLQKPGKLSHDEFTLVKTHTTAGAQLIEQIIEKASGLQVERLKLAKEVALSHHENWDGSGYPLGLFGSNIPLSGRLITIVDVYDALRSKRPYKEPFSHAEAVQTIENEAHKFDPEILATFKDINIEFAKIFETLNEA